jgi:F0F1-type ATP synthase assembly protein I
VSKDVQRNQTAATANLVGQVGCVTAFVAIVIIVIAFAIGWFLDDLMGNERKFMTVIMLLLSFPVTLYAMVRVSMFIVGRAQKQTEQTSHDTDQTNQENQYNDNKEEPTA